MDKQHWRGVLPAITTPFARDLSVDSTALATHVVWMIDNGCLGIVALG
jgi:4-hydroxy-tetrahydrodipicolinate synthase